MAQRALAGIVLLSLLLPWHDGGLELWFVLAMALLALNVLLLARSAIAGGALGCAMLLLTSLLLRREAPEWGAYIALAAEAGLIGLGVVSAIGARRA